MRKRCRVAIEKGDENAKVYLEIIDAELTRRGLRKPTKFKVKCIKCEQTFGVISEDIACPNCGNWESLVENGT
jgi:rRNA maturation endonuclease Nob1